VEYAHYLDNYESFIDALRKNPDIIQASASTNVPGDQITNWGFGAEGVENGFSLNVNITDENFIKTMGLELVAGRYFSRDFPADTARIVLNETAVQLLELEDPVGHITYMWNDRERPFEVIGVIKDYHWESKHMEIRPHALMPLGMKEREPYYISVRVEGSDYKKTIEYLKEKWEEEISEIPFQYDVLDQHYEEIYQNEQQTRSLLYIFSAIAIFISCLGLFGLASFMAERRTKEIGIRKTNGATTRNILGLLSIDFTKWVLLSNLIAWPLTWWAMRKWLEDFAYRIDVPYWTFLVAGMLAFMIALATVSFHAIRASRQNPGMSLRYE